MPDYFGIAFINTVPYTLSMDNKNMIKTWIRQALLNFLNLNQDQKLLDRLDDLDSQISTIEEDYPDRSALDDVERTASDAEDLAKELASDVEDLQRDLEAANDRIDELEKKLKTLLPEEKESTL